MLKGTVYNFTFRFFICKYSELPLSDISSDDASEDELKGSDYFQELKSALIEVYYMYISPFTRDHNSDNCAWQKNYDFMFNISSDALSVKIWFLCMFIFGMWFLIVFMWYWSSRITTRNSTEADTKVDSDGGSNIREQSAITGISAMSSAFKFSQWNNALNCKNNISQSYTATFLHVTADSIHVKISAILESLAGLNENALLNSFSAHFQRKLQSGVLGMKPFFKESLHNNEEEPSESFQLKKNRFLEEFGFFRNQLGWTMNNSSYDFRDEHKYPETLTKLLAFHQQNCVVNATQWTVSCLLVDYFLMLLDKELSYLSNCSPLKFIKFESVGSSRKGFMIGGANKFDILMLVQVSDCSVSNAWATAENVDVPAGSFVLLVNEFQPESDLVQPFGNKETYALSSSAVKKYFVDLVDAALQTLTLNREKLFSLEKLPCKMSRKPNDEEVVLCLDSSQISHHDFGLLVIKIHIKPAICLPVLGWYLGPMLYAVPRWKGCMEGWSASSELTSEFDPLFWQISFKDFEHNFLSGHQQLARLTGIISCYSLCLKILKSLFTNRLQNSLLDQGFLSSYTLETCLYYKLLESTPSMWTLDHLPDRFSDCIHFLRNAVRKKTLSNFFCHSHFLCQVPALEILFAPGQQENLLASLGDEKSEKILAYMQRIIQEAGLEMCIKDEFSQEQ